MPTTEATQKKGFRFKHIFFIGLGLLVVLFVIGGYNLSMQEKEYGFLAKGCEGSAVGASQASGELAAWFQRNADGSWSVDAENPDIRGGRSGAVVFLVCRDKETKEKIDTCQFRSGVGVRVLGIPVVSATGSIDEYPRVQHVQVVKVIEAKSGKVVVDGLVKAKLPPACDGVSGNVSESDFDGPRIREEDLEGWLSTHLRRQQQPGQPNS